MKTFFLFPKLLLLCTFMLIISCNSEKKFLIQSKNLFAFKQFSIETQLGTYSGDFLNLSSRVFVNDSNKSKLVFSITRNGPAVASLNFRFLLHKDLVVFFSDKYEFVFYVFDSFGEIKSFFPVEHFRIKSVNINELENLIRVVGIVDGKVKTALSKDFGLNWSISP
jgi:hypothetical protein